MTSRRLNWLAALSLLPFLLELPYIFIAMGDSPLEARNWLFFLLALAQTAFVIFRGRKNGTLKFADRLNRVGLWFIGFGLLCLAASGYKHIHFAILLSAVYLIWSSILTVCNWQTACAFLPVCTMLLLGIPSTGFLLGNATGLNGFMAKAIVAALLLLLTPLAASRYCPGPQTLLFSCGCLIIVAGYGLKLSTGRLAPAWLLQFRTLSAGGFTGTNMAVSESDRSFYGTDDIQRYLFSDSRGRSVHVLAVANVTNVHAIHPMAYCLRASRFTLESEQTIAVPRDGGVVYVHEITACRNGRYTLFWQWYSTPNRSTADFLLFRSIYSPRDDWRMMQVSADLETTPEDARVRLLEFTKAF